MDLAALWDIILGNVSALPQSSLLMATVVAVLAGVFGSMVGRVAPPVGRLLRFGSSLALAGILLMVVLQVSRMDPRFEMAVPQLGLPAQVVEGAETRVPLAPDGHYWLLAEVNGVEARFLVDTGATLTAISANLAAEAGLEARAGALPVRMQTANGSIAAEITAVDELRFGNVVARGLDAVIVPNLGDTNVVGMNMLSRLASWRVEGGTLILVPHHPQPVEASQES
ncbi:TIGR02281 family clan AA aspartic protease [Altererythrobacter xixiisoli]|uniref:TIGR02281 family clan AA aspartic protease n=1 Tax=Croceibacterium xixiisoli TaxID=1476466 RepID=A0A6I4TUT5_9SPHN|nr:TIGR02281 family clan AA aspartic protease [Croceibacterium xixiisoli]MXO99724.1 TIGR02281 family clan AA aspartic protease [Croceibacterium xixiisoli]